MHAVIECGVRGCPTDASAPAPDVAPPGPDAADVDSGVDDTAPAVDAAPLDAPLADAGSDAQDDVPEDVPLSVIPPLDTATQDNVRRVLAIGMAMGNRPTVFAKIGDSITESASFLQDIGHGWYDLGSYTSLMGSVTYFSGTALADGTNSFDRASVAAVGGWTSADALNGGDASPFMNELRTIHPAWAVIMFGTNDVDHWGVDVLTMNLQQMIDRAEGLGVVPILSTIPDRGDGADKEDRVMVFNPAIRALARSAHVPLVDYWYALQPLASHGVGPDGIHPNSYTGPDGLVDTGYFTTDGLHYGYNMRNLVVVQVLDLMRQTFTP